MHAGTDSLLKLVGMNRTPVADRIILPFRISVTRPAIASDLPDIRPGNTKVFFFNKTK
jgi:hypothetical protein